MKTASTDVPESQPQEEENKTQEQNRNFRIAIFQGIFGRISFSLSDSTTVLSAFIYKLTASNILVGLTGSIMSVGWMWPQLLISNLLEHKPRKMPFYILGMSVHITVWLAATVCTVWIGARNYGLLAASFISLYFAGTSSMGASSVAYMDIISKTIEPLRRARFFSLGNFVGGFFTIFIGFLVRYILSDASGFVFPNNYALLFFGVALMAVVSLFVFLKIHEPIRPVQTERKTFWQHIKQGPRFLQTDRNYRAFIVYRIFVNVGRMCMPFYVPYALDRLSISDATIGLFLAVGAVSGVLSNVLWGYMSGRYGVRWILICTALLACTAPLVAIFVQFIPPVWQLPCYFLTFVLGGASMSGMMVGFMTYMINIAPPLNRPTYIGFMNTLVFPFGFMPVLAGQLIQWIGYEYTFAIALGVGFFAFITSIRLEEVYHDEEFR